MITEPYLAYPPKTMTICLMGGFTAYGVTFKGAIEQLGGQNGFVFTAPLAKGHTFQGWADTFLVAQPS